MDRLKFLYFKSYKGQFKNFKENVILEIFHELEDEEIMKLKGYQIREKVKNYIKNSGYDNTRNAIQLNYYLVRGWAKHEASERIRKIQVGNSKKMHIKRKKHPERYKPILSPYTLKFWLNKGYSEREARFKIKESRSTNVEHWLAKGHSESEAREIISNLQKQKNKKFIEDKKNNPEKYKGILPNQIKYWLDRGYSEDEAHEIIKERQTTFSLEICIDKYGFDQGTKIFNERQKKWVNSLHSNFEKYGDGRSPQSKWVNDIKDRLKENGFDIPEKEKWMRVKGSNVSYSFDLTIDKKIIEFNGDYWHMNPKIYEVSSFNKSIQLTASEKWHLDAEKIKYAKSKGYEVMVIWEYEYISEPETVINKCVKFLND